MLSLYKPTEMLETAVRIIERTEVEARMGMHPYFCGCTAAFIVTCMKDDERFRKDGPLYGWEVYNLLSGDPRVRVRSRSFYKWWTTLEEPEFLRIFGDRY